MCIVLGFLKFVTIHGSFGASSYLVKDFKELGYYELSLGTFHKDLWRENSMLYSGNPQY